MSLPKWPGFCFDRDLGKQNRPKVQVLDRIRGTTHTYYNDKLFKSNLLRHNGLPSHHMGMKGPSWVVYDKKVLSFDGFWLESVMEEPDNRYMTRNCKVYFYLEDDTIQVVEPRIRNSKLCQGTCVKRRKLLKPPPNDNVFYNVYDFNIGSILELCGKYIKLVSCDNFTQNFLRHLGIDIPHPIQPPLDPIESLKSNLLASNKKGKGYYKHTDNLSQFLDYTTYILRFYCYWYNTDTLGDHRSMTLHYFLEDDTIEILENLKDNCGREGRIFLKRHKLPKNYTLSSLNFQGNLSEPSYLNVIKTRQHQHKLTDSLTIEDKAIPCYKACDLSVGQYINVYGRKFLLCDCDEFTKEYYRKKFGIFVFNSIDINQYWPKDENVEKFIPPYNGWGSEEDSMLNCLSIRPTEIIKSNKKFITSKKTIDDLLFINFVAKIDNPTTTTDIRRRFVISYSTETDTYLIMEETEDKHILFANRGQYVKPKEQWKDIYIPEYYECTDFYVGAKIHIKGFLFIIFSSDDYSLSHMEKNCHKFIYSSIERILTKLRKYLMNSKTDIEYFFKHEDPNNTGFINYKGLEKWKRQFATDILIPQELITLARKYTDRTKPSLEKQKIMAHVRNQLRINNFIDFYLIKQHWYAISAQSTKLDITTANSILKSMRIPLSDDLLCELLKISCVEPNEVDLCLLLDFMEWQRFQPEYYKYVGRFLGCEEYVGETPFSNISEMSPENHLKIGNIEWNLLIYDILNYPPMSKTHPSTQRILRASECIEAYD